MKDQFKGGSDFDLACMAAVENARDRIRREGLAPGETVEAAFIEAIAPLVAEALPDAERADLVPQSREVARRMVTGWKDSPFGRALFDIGRPTVSIKIR